VGVLSSTARKSPSGLFPGATWSIFLIVALVLFVFRRQVCGLAGDAEERRSCRAAALVQGPGIADRKSATLLKKSPGGRLVTAPGRASEPDWLALVAVAVMVAIHEVLTRPGSPSQRLVHDRCFAVLGRLRDRAAPSGSRHFSPKWGLRTTQFAARVSCRGGGLRGRRHGVGRIRPSRGPTSTSPPTTTGTDAALTPSGASPNNS